VSTVTIRSDLIYLERSQMLRRIRGGAIQVHPSRYERPVEINALLRSNEKAAIARMAVQMIHDGETVILDTGSTVEALAQHIPSHLANIAFVTNALNAAMELVNHPGATVIVTGGTLRPKLHSLISPLGTILLSEVNADIAFMSCAGVDAQRGFTNSNW
jgi:DeoR/GlpR family transcriptional regulator of sugar metabolism